MLDPRTRRTATIVVALLVGVSLLLTAAIPLLR